MRIKPKPKREANGFTLVEILIVIAILGILAAIAIPQMAAYRKRAIDSQVQYDIKNAAIAQEAYFVDMRTYAGSVTDGFTLIELLVVIAIIGILAAIAIPQFAAYRRRGYDSQAKSDLRNAATAEEAYFTDKNAYTSTISSLTGTYGYRQSANLTMGATGTSTTFVVDATVASGCSSGTGVWSFASSTGVITGTPCG